jgi:hypothetical protein
MWYLRWQVTRGLVWLAFIIAPRSPARDVFVGALDDASAHIRQTVALKGEGS